MKTLAISLALLSAPLHAAEPIRVSSFSTILTEIAQKVGGPRVQVTAHVKPGVDPHDFEPQPTDLKIVSQSQLVLLSAKHMEGYVNKLAEATGGKGNFLHVGDKFPSLKMADDHGHGHAHDDPHWWHSIERVQRATKLVRDTLSKISPADRTTFAVLAEQHLGRLIALEKWVKNKLAELPRDRRKLVTSHDAFQYFARENGFTIYPIEGLAAGNQPSSQKVAALIETIRQQGVKAIFSESIQNPKVLTEITRETGAKLGGELYADGLGEGAAATYEGMMKHNVTTIVDALK